MHIFYITYMEKESLQSYHLKIYLPNVFLFLATKALIFSTEN